MSAVSKLKFVSLLTFFIVVFLLIFGNIATASGYSSYFTANLTDSNNSNGSNVLNNIAVSNPTLNLKDQFLKSYQSIHEFTANKGQITDQAIKYYFTGNGLFIGFLDSKILFSYSDHTGLQTFKFNVTFKDSNNVVPTAVNENKPLINIFEGSNAYTGITSYNQIIYYNIYNNIDLRFYFTANGIKYEFISHNGNIQQIRLIFSKNLSLQVSTSNVNIVSGQNSFNFDSNLTVFDENTNSILQSSFVQSSTNSYGYAVQISSSSTDTILIDPILFSKILVPSNTLDFLDQNIGNEIKVDALGNIYVIGQASSPSFDMVNSYNSTFGGGYSDAFIMKFDKNWNLLFSTFVGGDQMDIAESIYIGSNYNIYVSGTTLSPNFPVTNTFGNARALAPITVDNYTTYNPNIFFLKLSSDGKNLLFSSIIGGEGLDTYSQILLDNNNDIILAGITESNDFPYMTNDPSLNQLSQPLGNVSNYFLAKFSPNGSKLLQCSLLQSTDAFSPLYMRLSANNTLVIASDGFGNLTTTSNALNRTPNGFLDVFLLRINLTNFQLIYDTFLGGNDQDKVNGLYIDQNGNIYITGQTQSTNFPTTANAFDRSYQSGWGWQGFVTKLNPEATKILASTYIGGSKNDILTGIVVDSSGSVYVTGDSQSKNYPTTANAMVSNSWGKNLIVITKFSPDLHFLYYSSYLGGSSGDFANSMDINAKDQLFITGYTSSTDFPSFFRLNQTLIAPQAFVLEFFDIPSDDLKYEYTLPVSHPDAIAIFLINYVYLIILVPIAILYFISVIKKRMLK